MGAATGNARGRPKGAKNKRTAEREQEMEKAAQQIMSVLGEGAFTGDAHALLVAIYKDPNQPLKARLNAAIAAIGYEKPRLSSIEATLDGTLGTYTAIPVEARHSDAVASTNGTAANGHSA
jgi:hypothetical protein